jgi:son of sevenless-like protein
LQLTGDDSAQAFHNARQAQANLPWYLKHRHSEEEIKLDFDGAVKAGTLPALVEHLVVDPLRESWFHYNHHQLIPLRQAHPSRNSFVALSLLHSEPLRQPPKSLIFSYHSMG